MDYKQECTEKMDKTISALKDSLATIRAGRVSPSLLDKVYVTCYGESMPLKHVATISATSPTDLSIKPFDPSTQRDIISGINKADLGCNPVVNAGAIMLKFPAPSEDRRKDLTKQCRKYAEDGKVALRNIRKDFNNKIKKDETLSEDAQHSALDDVQKVTDAHVAQVDTILAEKIKDIETI